MKEVNRHPSCDLATVQPHAPGANQTQPDWRAQRCQPATFMPHPSRHPTTADAVPLPSKEGRFTVYKRRPFPICAPPPSPRAKPVPPAPHRRRRYPSPAGRSPLISHLNAYSLQGISRSAASILRLCRGPSPRACILGITSIKTDSCYDTHICGEDAKPPYAPGAKYPQHGRASEAVPTHHP